MVRSHDDKKGLGYGVLEPSGRFEPRTYSTFYPYLDPDPYDDLEPATEEEQKGVRKKVPPLVRNDSMAGNSADSFYFVAGNTKLSDCFARPDNILSEVDVAAKSMSPVPSAYKNTKGASASIGRSGSSFPFSVGNYKRTGTQYGYSRAPKIASIYDADIDDLSDDEIDSVRNFNLKDFIDDEKTYNLIKHNKRPRGE